MAKGRGSKSTKLQAKRDGTVPKAIPSTEVTEEKTPRHVSEALRQAVKDLGGDDDDLDLIAGIDDSENEDEFESKKGKKSEDTVDEVCELVHSHEYADEQGLKKALGDFMKGLDFKSVAPDGAASADEEEEEDDEEEDGSDVSSFDSEDEEEDEEDEEEEEEEEDEEEEEESEEEPEPVVAAPVKAKVEKPKEKAVAVQPEVDNLGAKVSKATLIGPS